MLGCHRTESVPCGSGGLQTVYLFKLYVVFAWYGLHTL